jgi:DNA replication and repair protein RecF
VLFLPEDTFIFARGPASRRNFLNTVLATVPTYFSALVQYHRVLRQRNAALKQAKSVSDVEVWNSLLVEHATTIWEQRRLFVQFLLTHLPTIYSRLGGEGKDLDVRLVPGASDTQNFIHILETAFEQESRYSHTLYGPHRDDLSIWSGGRQVQTALSRGQMRLLVVALKVVATMYMKQVTGQEPLLLLDEILSELDEGKQRSLLENLPKGQVLLTCTKLPVELIRRDQVHMIDLRAILQPQTQRKVEEPVAEKVAV